MLLKKLASETMLYGLSSIVGRMLNFLLVPLYTRMLLQGEYGIVSELYSYSGFLMVLFSYRMESAFFRFGTPEADRSEAFSTGLFSLIASSLFLAGLAFVFAGPIAAFLNYAEHPEYVRWFGLILAFDALAELPFARLRLEQRPLRFVFAKLLNIGVLVGLNLFWLVFCPWASENGQNWVNAVWSPDVRVGYIFLSNVIASLATLLVLLPGVLKNFRAGFDAQLWERMLAYSGPLIVVSFAGIANEMLDRALLTRLLPFSLEESRAQLGVYGANYKLAMLITLFTQAYRYAAEPFFFKNAGQKDELETQATATKWFTLAATAGMLAILLFMDLVKGFIGKDFHSGLHVVPILLVANVLLGVYYNFSVWYRLKDRTSTGAWIAVGGALVTLVLNLWWVPVFGYIGSAWATLACYFFMCAATWWTGRETYPVPYPLLKMAAYLGLALAIWALSLLLKKWLVGSVLLGFGVSSLLFLLFLGIIWKNELGGRFANFQKVDKP